MLTALAGSAAAYSIKQASAVTSAEDLFAPTTPKFSHIQKVKPRVIRKVRSVRYADPRGYRYSATAWGCILPRPKAKGWELNSEVIFARTKGRVIFNRGGFQNNFQGETEYVDFNQQLGIPDHQPLATFGITYRFRPNWAMRYSIMPMLVNGGGGDGTQFTFGANSYNQNASNRVRWERLYHRAGLLYDPIRTNRARIGIFGEYVRIDERLSVFQIGCCGDTFDNEMNMGMAGIEFERCLKTGPYCNTLSLECRAGVAFLDEAVGADVKTGLKYMIPMGSKRWGFVEGGYRYITFKKGYNEYKYIDSAIEGGYIKMGFLF